MMPVLVQKEIKTSNVVAVIISFLTPYIVSLITHQSITMEAFWYSLVNGIGGLILVSLGTTISTFKKIWEIIVDTKKTPEEKLIEIEKLLVQLMQLWEVTWQKVKGIFVSNPTPAPLSQK